MPEMLSTAAYSAPLVAVPNGNGMGRLSSPGSVAVDPVTKAKQKALGSIDMHAAITAAVLSMPINMTPLQPVTASVAFDVVANTIAAGEERVGFLDQYGAGNASGLSNNNRAFASFVGGRVPNGQIILLHGFGAQVFNGSEHSAQEIQSIIQNTSLRLDLRGTEVKMGAMVDWPSILGPTDAASNGNNGLGRRGVSFPSVLQPEDTFTMTVKVERDITGLSTSAVAIHLFFKATRIYDRRVLGLS